MLTQTLAVFDITPDVELDVMTSNQSLAGLTVRAISEIDNVITELSPDLVAVQGDTTTAMSAAMAAFYQKIPVMHIEAGLRTFDRFSPFPEEINRVFIDHIATHCMAPTDRAAGYLRDSGIPEQYIEVTGNTAIDALLEVVKRIENSPAPATIPLTLLKEIGSGNKIITVTAHRRESFGSDFEQMCMALQDVVENNPDAVIAFPVHLNPKVREPVERILSNIDRIELLNPLPYTDFIWLLMQSHLVISDSGGVQEEVPSLNIPVLVMRKNTERPEGVEAGCAKLVGVERASIVRGTQELLENSDLYHQMATTSNPYGDGNASSKIADRMERTIRNID
jgi:UDP-N-acetylglucosamine 2-epimerase (non-hydrolysing)